jgi:hypothetical protein
MLDYAQWLTESKHLKLEGGNAVSGVTRINQENVEATLASAFSKVLPSLRLTKKDVKILGSTGKKNPGGTSGDIDMAISLTAMAESGTFKGITFDSSAATIAELTKEIGEIMKRKFDQVHPMPGLGIVSIAFPIVNTDGLQAGEFVQLDLMITDDLEYTGFAYHSPYEKDSRYKGIYRNFFLFAIAGEIQKKVITTCSDENGCEIPETWSRYWFDMKNGVMKGIQSIRGAKGLLKNPKVVSKEPITRVPLEVVRFLLGPTFDLTDVDSFEKIYRAVNSNAFAHKPFKRQILAKLAANLEKEGLPLPDELQ